MSKNKDPSKAEWIRKQIDGYMGRCDKSPDYMAVKMRVSRATWYRKMREPERMTVSDLEKLEGFTGLELIKGDTT